MHTIDYRTNSYYEADGKHLIRGFLIGTKPAGEGRNFSISKKTIADKVKQALGIDFIVVPDLLNKRPIDNHIYSDDYYELIEAQKEVSRGKVTNLFGPFPYDDGTEDIYYDYEAEITDKLVSDALAAGSLPLSVSPYIFAKENGVPIAPKLLKSRLDIEDWIPAHVALVKEGAFGWRAALQKQCFGPNDACHTALAASAQEIVNSISSLLRLEGQSSQMSDANTQNLSGPAENILNVPSVNNAPVKTETQTISTNTNQTQVSVEEFTKLQAEMANQKKVNEKLVLKVKTDALNKIFGSVADEIEKAKIIKKWLAIEDVDILADFHNDILTHIVPTLKIKEDKPKASALAASSECGCINHQKEDKTDFPLAGSSSGRLTKVRSLTELMGGVTK